MSDQMLRLVVGGVILVHGIAHIGAIGPLRWRDAEPWPVDSYPV